MAVLHSDLSAWELESSSLGNISIFDRVTEMRDWGFTMTFFLSTLSLIPAFGTRLHRALEM
jgi:hypothetical protein